MSEPRPMTADELRDDLLAEMRRLARFWANVPNKTTLERIEGALFSTLVLLDGHASMVGFVLVACPSGDDKRYAIEHGQNWVEDGTEINDVLHEHWHKGASDE
jgi:hypothetical protein